MKMKEELKEFRCTRNKVYTGSCSARFNRLERQGHYIRAYNAWGAIRVMARRFPQDRDESGMVYSAYYTADIWKENLPTWLEPDGE